MKNIVNNHLIIVIMVLSAGLVINGLNNEIIAAEVIQVDVAKMSQIDGERILLGQIAKIEGNDPQLIARLSGLVIGRSPLPGKTREIEANLVKRRLKQYRINLDQLALHIPSPVLITRSSIEITQEKIIALVSDYISKNLINNVPDARVKEIRVAEGVTLPGGRISYSVKPSGRSVMVGKVPFTVNFDINGKFYKRIWATAKIEVFSNVVVTKKPLGRHKPITEDDIEIQKMDLAELPSNVITDAELVLGQRTRRAIGSKTVLRSNLIEFPPLVKRGDVVVIIAESAGLKITALGQVKKKGRLGDRIPVINFDSKKVLYARVVDSNTVKVDLN